MMSHEIFDLSEENPDPAPITVDPFLWDGMESWFDVADLGAL